MVRDAVASVLAQREVRLELIVVDDGSSDGTAAEMERIVSSSSVVRFIRHERNRGVAAARNHGAQAARGPWLAFLDSDDQWMPDKLARQTRFFEQYPQYEIAQTGEVWIRGGVRVNPGRRHRKRSGDCFVESLRTCLVSPSAVMMRTAFFNQMGGFDEDLCAAEDYDLWLRIMLEHEVGLLEEPLVMRRAGHRGQLSASIEAIDRFRIIALLKLLLSERLAAARREAVVAVIGEKCQIYASGLRKRGELEAAARIAEIAQYVPVSSARGDARLAEMITRMRETVGGGAQESLIETQLADLPARTASLH